MSKSIENEVVKILQGSRRAHLIEVKYVCPTNIRGSRISLESLYWKQWKNERDTKRSQWKRIIDYPAQDSDTLSVAVRKLIQYGYKIVSHGAHDKGYWIAVEQFNDFDKVGLK